MYIGIVRDKLTIHYLLPQLLRKQCGRRLGSLIQLLPSVASHIAIITGNCSRLAAGYSDHSKPSAKANAAERETELCGAKVVLTAMNVRHKRARPIDRQTQIGRRSGS
jgi:hypothetical protein